MSFDLGRSPVVVSVCVPIDGVADPYQKGSPGRLGRLVGRTTGIRCEPETIKHNRLTVGVLSIADHDCDSFREKPSGARIAANGGKHRLNKTVTWQGYRSPRTVLAFF